MGTCPVGGAKFCIKFIVAQSVEGLAHPAGYSWKLYQQFRVPTVLQIVSAARSRGNHVIGGGGEYEVEPFSIIHPLLFLLSRPDSHIIDMTMKTKKQRSKHC